MSNPFDIRYTIEEFDEETATLTVRFVNPYGPLALLQKKPEECTYEFKVQRVNDDGEVETAIVVEPIENPNGDEIINIPAPKSPEGRFLQGEALHEHICRYAPTNRWNYVESLAGLREDEEGKKALSTLVGVESLAVYVPFKGVFANKVAAEIEPTTPRDAESAWLAENPEEGV